MAQVLPDTFAFGKMGFALTGTTHRSLITLGFSNAGGATATQCELDMRTAFFGTGKPFELANIATGWSFVYSSANVNIAGVETFFERFSNSAGTKTAAAVPINSAVLVQKVTGVAGRHNKGRMFVPPFYFLEGDVDMTGNIASTPLAAYQTTFTAAFAAMVTAAHTPVILHNTVGLAPTVCTGFNLPSLLATQRRRMR